MVAVSLLEPRNPLRQVRPFKETMDETLKILQAGGIQKPVLLITGTDVQGRFEDPQLCN